jgi:hypothetical protein
VRRRTATGRRHRLPLRQPHRSAEHSVRIAARHRKIRRPEAFAAHRSTKDWQLLDATTDGVPGISAERARRELLAGKQPARTVLVAVIDGGIDTAHVDLRSNLWTNPKEIAGNGRDDDNNGYVDDIHGWNFIGGKDGKDVHYDTFELTRLYGWCTNIGATPGLVSPDEKSQCDAIKRDFEKTKNETQSNQNMQQQVQQIGVVMTRANEILRRAMNTDSLTRDKVSAFRPTNPEATQAKAMWLRLADAGITPQELEDAKKTSSRRQSTVSTPSTTRARSSATTTRTSRSASMATPTSWVRMRSTAHTSRASSAVCAARPAGSTASRPASRS